MGAKRQRHTWPEAKKVCRLNQHDIEMAKRLGFGPDALIRAVPSPKQKWKLPVKYWIHELHWKRFGKVLGEKPPGETFEYHEEAADFWEQNQDSPRSRAITDDDVPF